MWPTIAYKLILYSAEIWTNLSYGHPLIPRCPDKRGLTVIPFIVFVRVPLTKIKLTESSIIYATLITKMKLIN